MLSAYAGAALGVLAIGQQSGAELLDQAIQQDLNVGTIMNGAREFAGLGIDAQHAAIIVALSGLAYKLLQMATPFANTLNDIWRQHALHGPQDVPPAAKPPAVSPPPPSHRKLP